MNIQQVYDEMMERYEAIKREVHKQNVHKYEQWKAGGFLVDSDILSMYPHLGSVVEAISPDEENPDDDDT